jgi:hypothetical protein
MNRPITHAELLAAIAASADDRVWIEAGPPGTDDHDYGYAYLDDSDDRIHVAWDSGVITPYVADAHTRLLGYYKR